MPLTNQWRRSGSQKKISSSDPGVEANDAHTRSRRGIRGISTNGLHRGTIARQTGKNKCPRCFMGCPDFLKPVSHADFNRPYTVLARSDQAQPGICLQLLYDRQGKVSTRMRRFIRPGHRQDCRPGAAVHRSGERQMPHGR